MRLRVKRRGQSLLKPPAEATRQPLQRLPTTIIMGPTRAPMPLPLPLIIPMTGLSLLMRTLARDTGITARRVSLPGSNSERNVNTVHCNYVLTNQLRCIPLFS